MLRNTEFSTFFSNGFQQELLSKESTRKTAARQQVFGIILIIVGILSAFALFHNNLIMVIVVGIGCFSIGGYLVYQSYKFKNWLTDFFKGKLIPEMIKSLGENLIYSPKGGIKKRQFVESKIFQNSIDIYETEDWVSGRVGATDIEFSELLVQDITKDDKGHETKNTIFKGIFFIADFHKDFNGETFVLRDQAQRLFGSLGTFFQRINGFRPELIMMENPVFEKQFVVYGTDQIESRYVITPIMMEKMVEMNQKFKGIQFSFVNSKMFVAIPFKENLFEPKLYTSFNDSVYIEEYFHVLRSCIGIVEDLNLNERIWTKE